MLINVYKTLLINETNNKKLTKSPNDGKNHHLGLVLFLGADILVLMNVYTTLLVNRTNKKKKIHTYLWPRDVVVDISWACFLCRKEYVCIYDHLFPS
jgi:hypothetical protein